MKDKIIFWLDADLTPFALAKFLQEKYEGDYFAVIDVTNKPKKFFQEQQLVKFQKVWYYHDHISKIKKKPDITYLESIEKKYQINLWVIAHNERVFNQYNEYYKFSTDEILSILEQECRLFEDILDEVKPDFLILKAIDLHNNHLFHQICRAKNVKVLMIVQSRFGYRCTISQDLDKFDFPEDLNNITASGRTLAELQNYLKGFDMFKQLNYYKDNFIISNWKRIKAAYEFLLISGNTNPKTHYTYYGRTRLRVLFKEIIAFLKTKYRESFINRNFIREIDNTTPFIYSPLHQEPEKSLLIAAPFYTNQLETIRHIAKSLPIGYKLYIKENPQQKIRDWRSVAYYKQIMNIPNVQLVHPYVKPEDIMSKCSLVVSVGGTAGLEAAFYQKPSIIFADLNYAILPSVYKLKAIEDLPQAMRLSLQKKVDPSDVDKFVNLYEKNSFEFDLLSFLIDYGEYFYRGGFLADVEIPIQKMESFLNKHKPAFEKLALEHIKKIKQHKEYYSQQNRKIIID